MPPSDSPSAIVLQFYQAFNTRNFDQAVALLAPSFVAHLAGVPEPLNREAFQQFGLAFFQAFPDGQHTFDNVLVDGNCVVTSGTFNGTHRAPFQGLPATGQQVKISLMHIDCVEDGQIVKHWGQGDQLGLVQQLGIVPVPGPVLLSKLLKTLLSKPFKKIRPV